MISKIIQTLTLVLIFFNHVNSTFQDIDIILPKNQLSLTTPRSGEKNLSLAKNNAGGRDNQYLVAYIKNDNKINIALIEKERTVSDTLIHNQDVLSVNLIEYSAQKYLLSFAEGTTGAPGDCKGMVVTLNGDTPSGGTPFTYQAGKLCTNVKATRTADDQAIAIMEVVDTDADIKVAAVSNETPQAAASITDEATGYSVNPKILSVGGSTKIVTAWTGAGKNQVAEGAEGYPLNFQIIDQTGADENDAAGDAQENVIVIGTQGNKLWHKDVQLVKIDSNSFTVAWNVETLSDSSDPTSVTDREIWFATYNLYDSTTNKVTNKCIENIKDGKLLGLTTVLGESLAYMLYTKDRKLYAMEISATECYPDRDEKEIMPQLAANSEFVLAEIFAPERNEDNGSQTGSGVFKIIAMETSSSRVHTIEYFHTNYSGCSNNCVGCFSSNTCPVCQGTTAEERMIRRRDDDTCTCQDGYFHSDSDENCKRCQHQCKTCTKENSCDTCKNDDMIEPGCLYPKLGHYKYDEDKNAGTASYGKCVSRCKNCVDKPTNCTECQGYKRVDPLNPDDNGYCPCESGYHDNYGLLKDCVKCPDYCKECYDDYRCKECHPDLKREINVYTGQCDCERGYISDDKTSVCVKGYMVSDGFIDACPKNTQQNESLQICEYLEYDLKSNLTLILVMGILIAIVQIALCNIVHHTLQKKYQAFASAFHEEQMKIKQQRDYIYKGLGEDGSSSNNGLSGMGGLEDGSKTGYGSPNKRRRRGGGNSSANLNQSNSLSSQQIQSMNSLVQESHNHLRDDGDIKQLDDI